MDANRVRRSVGEVQIPAEPLFGHADSQCAACWGCVRHCPARAIRITDGHAEIIQDRCVKCGVCATECGNQAHPVRSDLGRVRELLASERPVVLLLASEHIAALHPLHPHEAEVALESLGFLSIETTVLGEELVAMAYERVHVRADSVQPSLRSTCPVAVDWVRRFHPGLTGALVPIVPPYIASARLVRESYAPDVAIVYASPCWARKDEVYEEAFLGEVDVAIGFDELKQLMAEGPGPGVESIRALRPKPTKQLSAIDGFPYRTLRESSRADRDVVEVRGLDDLERLLTAITRGETCPTVVDMLACEGCIDGPCVNNELSVFMKRHIDLAERERQEPAPADSRTLLSAIPAVELRRTFIAKPAPSRIPSQDDIDRVLFAGEFLSRAETIDCGACGYDSCVEHAAAICLGDSSWELCFPLTKKRLMRERERYVQEAITDELTGLLNRRAFDARLAEEASRAIRYNTPLSLVMLDLDRFKDVNDRYGHATGDALLRAVGAVLSTAVRESDSPVRYGGDEFALVLPGATKVDAWAAAEKVRMSLSRLRVQSSGGEQVSTTVSMGVATLAPEIASVDTLLQAADAALYQAKRTGRDRVELAAG